MSHIISINNIRSSLTPLLKKEGDTYGKYYEYFTMAGKVEVLEEKVFKHIGGVRGYINYVKRNMPIHHEGCIYYHETTLNKYFKVKYVRMWNNDEELPPCPLGAALGTLHSGMCVYQFKTISKEDYDKGYGRDDSRKHKWCKACKKNCAEVKYCSRCRNVGYCSKECQVADWATHKHTCSS